ncbi:hypothetical protein ACFOMD_06560 [Sphingoaurantiacus capsulatus]|uniref:Lytic transglycosylase domain-containing protein n=1 Tax=Sphingoaurantiacus capsulatus TaxID=1771310 RepID=A0ABV7XB15_9SPHN
MRIHPWKAALAASVATLATVIALPVIGQEAPKSILPEGFDDAPPPPVAPAAPVPGTQPAAPAATPEGPAILAPGLADTAPAISVGPDPLLSAPTSRNVDFVGWLSPQAGGYGPNIFAGTNGRFLDGLLKRLDAPISSRWVHIVLRRALLSEVPTPAGARPADWVAERAWALVRMGEVDGAKRLVAAIPVDRYTPRLYAVAAQVHLAAGDALGLCALAPTAITLSKETLWPLANGLCAALEGDDLTAATTFDGLRNREAASPFDISLAERLATAASGTGRAANVEWNEVTKLNVYRFGLSAAGGVAIPEELAAKASPAVQAWLLRNPSTTLDRRLAAAPTAAALGVSSAAEMVRVHSAYAADMDPFAFEASPSGRLRAAFVARSADDRMTALRTLWARGNNERERFGAKILTAQAAARFPVDDAHVEAAPELVESALSAGYTNAAMRWWPLADDEGGSVRDRVWALVALADRTGSIPADTGRFDDWFGSEKSRVGEKRATYRAQLLAAALSGLGRGSDWDEMLDDLEVAPLDNAWSRRLDAAAQGRRIGEVAILAGIGLQRGVPPRHLQKIIAAYARVGLQTEARMLAVEALTRA